MQGAGECADCECGIRCPPARRLQQVEEDQVQQVQHKLLPQPRRRDPVVFQVPRDVPLRRALPVPYHVRGRRMGWRVVPGKETPVCFVPARYYGASSPSGHPPTRCSWAYIVVYPNGAVKELKARCRGCGAVA